MGIKGDGGMELDGNTAPVTRGWRAPACSETSVGGRGALAHRNFRTQRLPTKLAPAAQIDTLDGFSRSNQHGPPQRWAKRPQGLTAVHRDHDISRLSR